MPEAPDPPIQLLKNDVLPGLIPFDVGRGQIVLRIVAPKSRKCSVPLIHNGQIVAQLQLIVYGDGSIGPVCCFVIGQGLALQNTALTVFLPHVPPVDIGKSILKIGMLVKMVVINDSVSRLQAVKMGGNRLQHVSHQQLFGIRRSFRLHAPLFHQPKFQRRHPGRQAKNDCHIAAADRVLNITFRPMFPAFQPAFFRHPCAVTEDIGRGHYHFTSLA